MEKIIKRHLVGFGSLKDMDVYSEHTDHSFTDGGMTAILEGIEIPTKEECDQICKEFSGEVIMYYVEPLN